MTFLLLTCSLALGSLIFFWGRYLLEKFSKDYREIRLKGIVRNPWAGKGNDGPWGNLGSMMGEWLGPLWGARPLAPYAGVLRGLAQRAGRSALSVPKIIGQQALFGLGGALSFSLLAAGPIWILAGFCSGACLPYLRLRELAIQREKAILRDLPTALESLALCSEAGLSLEQGMEQYDQSAAAGPLREEFSRILTEARSGASRKSALQTASSRLDLTDFSLFATSLVQAEKFGTGISKTLLQLSRSLRDQQAQRAEKAVQELPVKLLLPLVLCIMPVTFLVIFGPVLLQFFRP